MSRARTDADWLGDAVALALSSAKLGGGPFGAIVVGAGQVLGRGVSRVTRDKDPTAHAEVVAIRQACASRHDFSLAGTTLYSSCEPCPLCLSAAMQARVERVVYAADRKDAARVGFDDLAFYELLSQDRSEWDLAVEALAVPGADDPFDTWLANAERVAY